jgi:hypothetical protein
MAFLMQDVSLTESIGLPLISLIGAIGLLAVSLVVTWRLIVQVLALERALSQAHRRLRPLLPHGSEDIDEERLRKLTEIFVQQPAFRTVWQRYRRALMIDGSQWYETPRVYATQPASEAFTQDALFCRLNLPFYRSFPAMLTGAGLLLTFLAFFIGLSKIQIFGSTISGLPGLVNGLSGKFVTSIVGLFCASAFAALEKILMHRLLGSYHAMLERLEQIFPFRTSSELLLEITQYQGENARLLKYMGLDLAQHFRKSLTETMAMPITHLTTVVHSLKGRQTDQAIEETPTTIERTHGQLKAQPMTAIKGHTAGDWQRLEGVFERLEQSALRQEQLLTRLGDILLPWTEVLPKARASATRFRRGSTPEPIPLGQARHSA